MGHSSSFARVIILVDNCEDIMAYWLLDVGVESGFADVGFGAVNALQRGAGVED